MTDSFVISLVIAVIQFILGLVLSMGSVYISLKLFDKFTRKLDEWKEIKKGNLAVGVLLGGIILSIAIVIEGGVSNITAPFVPGANTSIVLIGFVIGLINLIISIVAAIIAVYVAINVLDWITTDIDEMGELKKGNVAVAVMMVAVLIGVSFVIKGAVSGLINVFDAVEILRALGL